MFALRQGACYNFQAFALGDRQMVAQEGCHIGQNLSYRSFSFC